MPDAYSQVRVTNGSSCVMSETNVPIRAKTSVIPMLNMVCSNIAGATSSQRHAGPSVNPTTTNRMPSDTSIWLSSFST